MDKQLKSMEKMGLSRYSQLINKVCSIDSSHILDDRGEPPLWPLNVVETLWCLGKFYPRDLFNVVKELEKRGYSQSNLAEVLRFPTRLTDLFHFIEVPIEGLTITQKVELFSEVVAMAKKLRRDPFCQNGRNEIWSREQIINSLKSCKWVGANPRKNNLVNVFGKLHALMFLYCEFIWVGGRHQLSHEIHGPYQLDNNKLLLVREYYDLKPEVWPFTDALPMDSFTLLEIYDDIPIKLDCYNHIEFFGPLTRKLKSFTLVGESPSRIRTFYDKINLALAEGGRYVSGFQKSDWLKKAIEMQSWSIKPLKDLLHTEWRLEPELIRDLMNLNPEPFVNEMFRDVEQIVSLGRKMAQRKLTNYFFRRFYAEPA